MNQSIKLIILTGVLAVVALGGTAGLFWLQEKLEVKETKIVQAQAYTVRAEHPRLHITKDTLPMLRQRAATTHKDEYKFLLDVANTRFSNPSADYYNIVIYGLLYQLGEISGFSYTHTPEEYGKIAAQLVEKFADSTLANPSVNEKWSANGYFTHALSVGYDWAYNFLTDEAKTKIVNAIIYVRNNTAPLDRGDVFGIVGRQVPIGGLAFYGDGINDAKAQEYVDLFQPLWREALLLALELVSSGDGGHVESYGYSGISLKYGGIMLDAWRTATGENLFPNSSWHLYYSYWLTYICQTRPTAVSWEGPWWRSLKIADSSHLRFDNSRLFALPLIASVHKDLGNHDEASLTTWFIQNKVYYWSYGRELTYPWDIIWYDKTITPKSPFQLNLSLTRRFRGAGQVIMRSGFESGDDTLAAFISAPYWVHPHSHPHQNSFIIEKRGELALDSGRYEDMSTTHDWNYHERTIAHNTITVYEPNEKFYRDTNDGGQRVLTKTDEVEDIQPGSKWDIGGIARFEPVPNEYDYIMGDATRAYQSTLYTDGGNIAKISNFTRQFIYLRPDLAGDSDIFVVFDRVGSTNASFVKKWLLHMPFEPTVSGNSQAGACAGHTNYDGDTVSFDSTTHESKLFSKTLLPLNHRIVKIGGAGHEFESANCDNWPISPTYNTYKDWMGAWRIEVEPTEARTDDIFLHVLQTADSSTQTMFPTQRIESTTNNMVGTQIADPSGSRITMFSKAETKETGGLAENITYNISGQGTSKHLIVDLKPNTTFTVQNTNLDTNQVVETKTLTSSAQGTLYFTTNLGSNHQIVITPGTTPPPPQTPNIILTKSILVNGQPATEAAAGDELTYTITYQNTGAGEAKNIVITDNIPNGTTYISGGDRIEQAVVYWDIPSLATGATGTVELRVIAE